MLCAKCASPTEHLSHGGLTVARCTRCRGLWLDPREREKLMEIGVVEGLDSEPDSVARRVGALDRAVCPRCDVSMLHLVDARRPEVHFEQCPECGGSFLDAGELTALRPTRLARVLRGLFGWAR